MPFDRKHEQVKGIHCQVSFQDLLAILIGISVDFNNERTTGLILQGTVEVPLPETLAQALTIQDKVMYSLKLMRRMIMF